MSRLNRLAINGQGEYRVGYGSCHAHHGELLQGQISNEKGYPRRCLMTLPCEGFYSEVSFFPDSSGELRVDPAHKEKTRRTVELLFGYLEYHEAGGLIQVSSNIEECKGYGSSTADCVAGALAAADAFRLRLPEEDIAQLIVQAEQASDNVMFSNAVLFAHREGIVIEDYAKPVPEIEMLGIDTEPEGTINTLGYTPVSYSRKEVQYFEMLVAALKRAIRTQDRQLLGCIATASANINEQFLPKPGYKEIQALAERMGALGVAVAHSGTVVSIMLDPTDEKLEWKAEALYKNVACLGFSNILRLRTHPMQIRRNIP
jgi:uncharacterized protein involved in propanediol utilization